MVRWFLPGAAAIGFLLYPAFVYLFIERWPIISLIALLAALGAARLVTMHSLGTVVRAAGMATLLAFCGIAWATSSPAIVKLYPVLICAAGMGYGVWTLIHPPSAIERLVVATNTRENLDSRKRAYMRRLTQIWVGFFCLNGAVAAYTALGASTTTWAVYNGVVSYALMAVLFGGEYAVRTVFRRRHYSAAT